MSRTILTPVALVADSGVALGAGTTPDATNGNIVASPGPNHGSVLVTNNAGASITLIVRASGYTGAANGAANSAIAAPGWPLAQSSLGDLSVTVAAGATEYVSLSTSDRYIQTDGSVWLDWSSSSSVVVWFLTSSYDPI